MKIKIYILLFLIVTAFVVFLSRGWQEEKGEKQLQTIKIAQFGKEKFLLYLPLYTAMELGYFTQEGFEVDLTFAGNDDQVFAAVAGGSVDFGVGDPVFTAIANEHGLGAKTIALMIKRLGISGYTKDKNIMAISDVKDLAGLRIGSFPKPSTTYTVIDTLIKNNVALSETKIIEAAFGAQVALIEAGQADIAIDIEPTVSKLEAQGYRVVFDVSDYMPAQAITGVMALDDTLKAHPEMAQGLVNALQRALKTLHENPEVGIDVASKLFPDIDEAVIRNAVIRMQKKDVYPQSAVVPDAYWQRTLSARIKSGELKHRQETTNSVDNSFALKAVK